MTAIRLMRLMLLAVALTAPAILLAAAPATVDTPAGDIVICRAYQVVAPDLEGIAPSPAYKGTIVRGARAIGLPAAYIEGLERIEDNGFEGGGPH